MPPTNNQLHPQNTSTHKTSSEVMTPEQAVADPGIQINDVSKSVWAYVKKRKLWEVIVFTPLIIVWEIFVIYLFITFLTHNGANNSSSSGKGFGYMFIAPFIIVGSWVYRIRRQFEDAFLEEFAQENNYQFDKNGLVDETYGSLFRLHGSQKVSDVVTGKYNDATLRLFLYELTVGTGRDRHTYVDTVIELDLDGKLPQLLLENKGSRFSNLNVSSVFGSSNKVSLEGDFDKYFTLYTPKGNEVEALEVFSPDTMQLMELESKNYSVEFAANKIYIYSSGFIGTSQNLLQAFSLAKKLIDKIGPLAERLEHDSAIIAPPINLTQSRKHISSKFVIITSVLTFVIIASLFAIGWFTANQSKTNYAQTPAVSNTEPTVSPQVTQNPPYCGTVPTSQMALATKEFVNAVMSSNTQRDMISSDIANANNTITLDIIKKQIQSDQSFIANIRGINFNTPESIQNNAVFIASLQNYDNLLTQSESTYPNITTTLNNELVAARQTRSNASANLRRSLGLQISTCTFREP